MTSTARKRKLEETEEDSAEEGLQRKRTKSFNDESSSPASATRAPINRSLELETTAIVESDDTSSSEKEKEEDEGDNSESLSPNETSPKETIEDEDNDKTAEKLAIEIDTTATNQSETEVKTANDTEKQLTDEEKASEEKNSVSDKEKQEGDGKSESLDLKTSSDNKKEEPEKKASAPKIFGSTSFFASSTPTISVNVFADDSNNASENNDASKLSNGKVFGTGSIFGASFTSSSPEKTKKNIFEDLPAKKVEKITQTVDSSVIGELKEDNPDLKKQEIETGEELEESVYSCRCKLYALDPTAEKMAWKERGVGSLHINTNNSENKSRMVMRSDGSLRVILNMPLTKNIDINMGMKSSFASDKIVRLTSVEGEKPIQYAFKVASASIATELYDAIEKLVS